MSQKQATVNLQTLDWADAYQRFSPLLLKAVARLVRAGFFVPPDQAFDLIHDFFLEAWPGLSQRYNPALARPETYLFRAFTQFSKRRILKSRRQNAMLSDVARVGQWNTPLSASEPEDSELLATVSKALANLPPLERDLLNDYLTSSRSERALAEHHGMTRYRVRELLVQGIGRVAATIDSQTPLPVAARNAVLSHWRQDIPLEQTARLLQIPPHEIRQNRSQLLREITQTVRRTRTRSRPPTNEGTAMDAATLIKQVLTENNEALFEEVRRRSGEMVEYFQNADDLVIDEATQKSLEQNPGRLDRLYEALAGEEVLDAETEKELQEQIALKDADDRSIGEVFRKGLIRDLDKSLTHWSRWFGKLPLISEEEQRFLSERPDMIGAQHAADQLVVYGITPLTIFYSALSIHIAIDRMIDAGKIQREDIVLLTADPVHAVDDLPGVMTVPTKNVVGEIESMAEVSAAAAAALLRWLIAVAQERPAVFPEFDATPQGDGVRLKRIDGEMTLKDCWTGALVLS